MAIPTYGAAPLSKTFFILRGLQLVCFVGIIGIIARFISQIVSAHQIAPKELVATISVTAAACLYCLISIPFFWAQANVGLLVMAGLDSLLLIAFVVVSIILGKPLASLECEKLSGDIFSNEGAYEFTSTLSTNMNNYGSIVNWSGATKSNCLASKTAWGLCVGLCILFTSSAMMLPALFAKQKRAIKGGTKGMA